MRNRIIGAIGAIFGALILIGGLMRGGPAGEGAYRAGQITGIAFGGLLLVVGLYYLFSDTTVKKKARRK